MYKERAITKLAEPIVKTITVTIPTYGVQLKSTQYWAYTIRAIKYAALLKKNIIENTWISFCSC